MRGAPSLRTTAVAAGAAFAVGVGALTLLDGYSTTPVLDAVQFLAVIGLGAVVIGGAVALALVQLADWRAPEEDFERIVQRAERLAAQRPWATGDDGYGEDDRYLDAADYAAEGRDADQPGSGDGDSAGPAGTEAWGAEPERVDLADPETFRALVRAAARELPLELCAALEHVAIVVTQAGAITRIARGRHAPYGVYQHNADSEDYFHDRVLIFRDRLLRDFGSDAELLREQIQRTLARELAARAGARNKGVHRR